MCDECDYKTSRCDTLKTHKRNWHSVEGMNRKKKQEERVRTVLQSRFLIDEQIHLRYQNSCVVRPDKYCAFVDFHVVNIVKHIVLVECQEMAHEGYPLSCELTRMERIHEALLKAGFALPVVFICYNPNGRVTVDGKVMKILRKSREIALLSLLQNILEDKVSFDKTLNVVYLFYSLKNGVPEICFEADYNEQAKNCVDLGYLQQAFYE